MTDFNKKSTDDLTKLVSEKREEIRSLRFSAAGTVKKNVKATFLARKEVARALTLINARKSATV